MRLPKIRIRNTTFWIVIIAVFLPFFPLVYFMERQDFFKMMDSVLIAAGVGIIFGVAKGVWDALKLPVHDLTAADIGLAAILMYCSGGSLLFGMRWYWRAAEKIHPEPILDGVLAAFGTYTCAASVLLLMAALFSRDGRVVVGTAGKLAAFVAGAVLFCGLLIGLGLS